MRGIYQIECRVTGKCYIGSSMQLRARFAKHKSALRGGYHHNPKLQNAWNNYGEAEFKFSILEQIDTISLEDLLALEQRYIDEVKPELNCNPRTDIPPLHPEALRNRGESIRKFLSEAPQEWWDKRNENLSQSTKEYWENLSPEEREQKEQRLRTLNGRARHEAAKRGMSLDEYLVWREQEREAWEAGREERALEGNRKRAESKRGKPRDPATVEKMREAALKNAERTRGVPRSEEVRQKMSEAQKRNWEGLSPEEQERRRNAAAETMRQAQAKRWRDKKGS